MVDIPSPFGGPEAGDDDFDDYDEFVPEHVPEPGPFLEEGEVLTGEEHLAFHRLSRSLFEERAVYDVTFGYNLARLNCDPRHSDAGYRYARDPEDPSVLRAEFTPTTPFCPQSDTLTKGSFRAWNDLTERHEFDLVRVRVAPMHDRSSAIDEALQEMEAAFREQGRIPDPSVGGPGGGRSGPGGVDDSPAAPF